MVCLYKKNNFSLEIKSRHLIAAPVEVLHVRRVAAGLLPRHLANRDQLLCAVVLENLVLAQVEHMAFSVLDVFAELLALLRRVTLEDPGPTGGP